MTTIADIARKWNRKTELHRGLQLDAASLDILNAMGIGKQIAEAAAEYQRNQCQKRVARNQSISGGNTGSTGGQTDQTSKSSGMTPKEDANEALARALEMCGRGS